MAGRASSAPAAVARIAGAGLAGPPPFRPM